MSNRDKIWIKLMEICCKYWGCHQMPERSFFIKKYQLPVCARCTGMMVGYIASTLLVILKIKIREFLCVLLMIPMIVDGCIQYKTKYLSNNIRRFITGIMYGIGLIQLIVRMLTWVTGLVKRGK